MKIRDLLDAKGRHVVTITPDHTVLAAMRLLVERNIGSLVVVQGDDVLGIVTERDILRLGVPDPDRLKTTRVGEAMTADLVVALPNDDVQYVMEIMTRNRIRHLPVIENGGLGGILSIGDVVNSLRTSVEAENRYLRDYIQGVVA